VELHDDENAWSSKNHSILFDDNVLQTCHGYAKINEPIFLLFLSCASTSVILARVTRALCYNLKGTVSRDFCIKFFHESSSPKPLKFVEIFARQGTPPVSLDATGGKFCHCYRFATGVNDTGDKFAAVRVVNDTAINNTSGNSGKICCRSR